MKVAKFECSKVFCHFSELASMHCNMGDNAPCSAISAFRVHLRRHKHGFIAEFALILSHPRKMREVRENTMKKIIALFVLALMLSFSTMANAEGTGMYIAPKFLMSIQDTGTVSKSWSLAGSGLDEYSQFSLGGALAIGYDLWPQQMIPLRFEVELALRGNSEKKWDDNGVRLDSVKAVWNNSTLFGNVFWDFHNDSSFTPYIGAGLGIAFNYTGYDFTTHNGETFSIDDRFTNFAWNAGAGVAYSFNDMIALDASYRFVSMGYNEINGYNRGTKYEIGNDPYNNEFTVGLRFSF